MLILKSKRRQMSLIILLAASALMVGCSTRAMHNKGMSLVQEGKFEDGITNLEKAYNADTDNVSYRADYLRAKSEVTSKLLANASSELALGHYDAAQSIFERVLVIDKDNRNAKLAIEMLAMNKRHDALVEEAKALYDKGEFDAAQATLKPVLLENSKNSKAVILLRQIEEQQNKMKLVEPALMQKFKKPVSLQFRDANVKMVFEALSRTTGINVLLDKDVRSDLKSSIFVKDVSVEDAIALILMQNQLEKKIISENTVYIYPSTPAKIKEFQDLKIRSFHLTNADPKQMMTMIKTLIKSKDIYVNEKTNSVVMRDTPDAIHLAEKMISDQDIADPEVMLEVEVLEISRSRLSEIGIKYPTTATFSPITSLVNAPGPTGVTVPQLTLEGLQNLNSSNIAVTPPSITLNAMLTDSDTNILSSPRLRVRNREKAKIMIGERVPIITNSITPITGGTGSVITGTVTYQDVGLKLDVEPDIHLDNEVTIRIGLEVSSLGAAVTNTSGSVVYQIGTRNTSTSLRLRDGETQILGGLITDNDRSTVDKVPLLGQIPILGHLFSNDNSNKSKTEIILSITPHLVGNAKLADARETEYWSGTEASLRSSQIVLKPLGAVVLGNTLAPASVPMPVTSPVASNLAASVTPPVTAKPLADGAQAAPAITAVVGIAALKVTPPANTVKKESAAADQTIALSWQGPSQAKVGDKITLNLNAPTSQGLKTLGFKVSFDSEVLKAIEVNEGGALKYNNVTSSINKNINQASGEITADITGSGAPGNTNIVMLTFEVVSAAQGTTISLDSLIGAGVNGDAISVSAPEPHVISLSQ